MKRKRNPKPIVLKIYIEHKVKSHKKLHGMVFFNGMAVGAISHIAFMEHE
jgi:hypothetical protein